MQFLPHPPSTMRCPQWLILLIAISGGPVFCQALQASDALRETAFVDAVKNAVPAVVNIHGRKMVAVDEDHPDKEVRGMGTGVIVDPRGYILTNFHVVDGVKVIQVTMADKQVVTARLIAHDQATDLAVIKISWLRDLPTIRIGSSKDLLLAEPVVAVGNAYGYHHSVTRGIISALHRDVPVSDTQTYFNLIQTDASINPGNSGGPLLNVHGDMIGLNVAVRVGAQGIGFAIPVDEALDVAARLLNTQNVDHNWHGIVGETKYHGTSPRFHVVAVQSSATGSLRSGDVITSVGGSTILRGLDFERALIGQKRGQPIPVIAQRDNQVVETSIVLTPSLPVNSTTPESRMWSINGLRLTPMDKRHFANVNAGYRGGLKVTAVRPGSAAEKQNIRPGDVLVGVHLWETLSMDNIEFVMQRPEFKGNRPAKCFILRDNRTHFAYLPISDNQTR